MTDQEMLIPINEWRAMTDFLEKKQVPFRECEDGIYRPDFSSIAKSEEQADKMEQAYVRKFAIYVEFIRAYYKGEVVMP